MSTLPKELEVFGLHVLGQPLHSAFDLRLGAASKQGVRALERIPPGSRFGPFEGELKQNVDDISFAWELVDSTGKVRGWLDGKKSGSWLTKIQTTENESSCNVQAVQVEDEVYYQTNRFIDIGEELLLYHYAGLIQEKDLNIITRDNQGHQNFPCLKCHEFFKSKVALRRHETYVCNNQYAIFNNHHSQSADNSTHGEKSLEILDCPSNNNCSSDDAYNIPREYNCSNCAMKYFNVDELENHLRTVHPGSRSHVCYRCSKTFSSSSGLKQHMHIHSSVKPFQCDVCSKAYTQFSNLCRHKRLHRTSRMELQCKDCGKRFGSAHAYSRHRQFFCGNTNVKTAQENGSFRTGINKFIDNHYNKNMNMVKPISTQSSFPTVSFGSQIVNSSPNEAAYLNLNKRVDMNGNIQRNYCEMSETNKFNAAISKNPEGVLDLRMPIKNENENTKIVYNVEKSKVRHQINTSPYLPAVDFLPHPYFIGRILSEASKPLLPPFSAEFADFFKFSSYKHIEQKVFEEQQRIDQMRVVENRIQLNEGGRNVQGFENVQHHYDPEGCKWMSSNHDQNFHYDSETNCD